jgi:hypothetical protein
MTYLKILGGLLLAVLLLLITLFRIGFEIIGASTAPDDFALLKQRMPNVLEWLFTTPWPVPSALLIGIAALAAWLLVTGTRKAANEGVSDAEGLGGLSMDDVKGIVADYFESHLDSSKTDLSGDELQSIIDVRLDQFVDTKISAKFETHAQAHVRDVKLADLSDRTKAVEKKLDLLTTYTEQIRPILRDRFDNVDYGFAAIYNRERHQRLFSDLETSYENLAQPVHSGAGIANDATWQKQVKKWRVDLEQWLIIADYYAMGAKDRINKIHELMYDGEWTFNEAQLSANQVHRFKEASILWHNAKEEKPQIDKCLEYAAFHGPSKKGRDDAPPRPREDQ